MIWGARSAIIIAIVPITIATLVGLLLGSIAGFMGRAIEVIIMRILDVFFGLPAVLLAVLVGVTLGPGLWNMLWAITIVIVPPMARVTYTAVVIVREQSYIEAARAVWCPESPDRPAPYSAQRHGSRPGLRSIFSRLNRRIRCRLELDRAGGTGHYGRLG